MSIYNPPVASPGEVAHWTGSGWELIPAGSYTWLPPAPTGLPAGYTPTVTDGEWVVVDDTGPTIDANREKAYGLLAISEWTQIDGVSKGLTNKASFDAFRTNVYNILKTITAGDIEWPVMPTPTWS